MPSIFTNEYSRGPLYQYWKERGQEEKALREQRIQEAKLRSKGFQPMSPAFGPSSTDAYAQRATSGPPAYHPESSEGAGGSPPQQHLPPVDELPPYGATAGVVGGQSEPAAEGGGGCGQSLLSSEEEKARLRRLEEQHRHSQADSALTQTLSAEDEQAAWTAAEEDDASTGKGKQPERRRSTAGKIGRWLADAASGYTKKQERW
ncbi:uncharacterized protein Z519_07340 [Cladophialophora bantiana CBS 173.52]|uniref:Uncharacterized protein n=1 Tax=Cladophialophora bantiana (strain ATCC 10958 / CBS 173.52 / CDC B-1940 / NIH 8579) TaxID=1442370 RepID=A0A0D2ER35_CLAB1|nr:uncharacterized protein Z519_07340 [Cladophialophora bantiana CBS 173.52]KIW92356.1 hypothetical protein Z519_07340 [Cladophialophora bantiana CBS 173.52]